MAATSIIAMLSVSLSGLPIHATETGEPAAPNTSTTTEVSDEDGKSTSDTKTALPATETDPITTSSNDANPESVSEVANEEVPVSTTETQSMQNSTPAPSSENTGISFSCAYKDADGSALTPSQSAGISLDADGSIDINSLAPAIDNFDFDHASIEYGETTAALSSLQRQTTTDGVTKYSYSTDGSAWTEITGADSATIVFNYKATVTEPQELKLYADCVDETGAAITDGSHKELTVDGTLKLDDATAAPFTFEGYTYPCIYPRTRGKSDRRESGRSDNRQPGKTGWKCWRKQAHRNFRRAPLFYGTWYAAIPNLCRGTAARR